MAKGPLASRSRLVVLVQAMTCVSCHESVRKAGRAGHMLGRREEVVLEKPRVKCLHFCLVGIYLGS